MNKTRTLTYEDFHKTIEMPWKKSFLNLMRPKYLDSLVRESDFCFSEMHSEFVRSNWHVISRLTLLDPFRLGNLLDLLDQVKHLKGDIVECGSYRGGAGILMGLWLKQNGIDKSVHLFDSFEGLPEPDASKDSGYKKGQFVSDFETLNRTILSEGLSDVISIHKGWFKDTVPRQKGKGQICLLHIDCDLYTSTNDCLPALYPDVVQKGLIVLDDFNDGGGGEKTAVHELLSLVGSHDVIQLGPAPQSFIVKDASVADCFQVGDNLYSYSRLAENSSYLAWLSQACGFDLISQLLSLEPSS